MFVSFFFQLPYCQGRQDPGELWPECWYVFVIYFYFVWSPQESFSWFHCLYQSAPIWDVSCLGLLLPTSSSAHAMDLNIPPRVLSFVDPLLFLLHLLIVTLMLKVERLSLVPGRRKISVPAEKDGGTKLMVIQ